MFDCGPLGDGGHGHYDLLSVELFAAGRPLVVDPGRGSYSEAPPNLRRWFRGTAAHNTVCVDGLDQTPYTRTRPKGPVAEGRFLGRATARGRDALAGEARSPAYDAVHRRRVTLVDGRRWLIEDRLSATAPHRYDLRFHLPPDAQDAARVDGDTVVAPGVTLRIRGRAARRAGAGLGRSALRRAAARAGRDRRRRGRPRRRVRHRGRPGMRLAGDPAVPRRDALLDGAAVARALGLARLRADLREVPRRGEPAGRPPHGRGRPRRRAQLRRPGRRACGGRAGRRLRARARRGVLALPGRPPDRRAPAARRSRPCARPADRAALRGHAARRLRRRAVRHRGVRRRRRARRRVREGPCGRGRGARAARDRGRPRRAGPRQRAPARAPAARVRGGPRRRRRAGAGAAARPPARRAAAR